MTSRRTFGIPHPTMPLLHHPITASGNRLTLLLGLAFSFTTLQAQVSRFNVLNGDEMVGSVTTMRSELADRTIYVMTSHSEFDIIWKQVIRSSGKTEYVNGQLASCHTSLRVNNAVRDSSSMKIGMDQCFVHPKALFNCSSSCQWTTARMYYEEPVDQRLIFVESVLKDCPLQKTGPNTYLLTLPNKHVNHYVYVGGVLQEIRVERALLDLVFRRA